MPYVVLHVHCGSEENPRSASVYIFGTHRTRQNSVTPIELHTKSNLEMKNHLYQKVGKPELRPLLS